MPRGVIDWRSRLSAIPRRFALPWNDENAVGERIERELTTDEKKQAAAIAVDRLSETAAQVMQRDRQVEGGMTIVAVLETTQSCGGCVWRRVRLPLAWKAGEMAKLV